MDHKVVFKHKKLIKGAKKADADFVKFQNWSANKLVTVNAKWLRIKSKIQNLRNRR